MKFKPFAALFLLSLVLVTVLSNNIFVVNADIDKDPVKDLFGYLPLIAKSIAEETNSFTEVHGVFQQLTQSYGPPVWFDYGNDGDMDVFLTNHTKTPSFLENNGDGVSEEIINSTGIYASTSVDRHGVAAGDYDNDGDVDLFITTGAALGATIGQKEDELYENNGSGVYLDVTRQFGVENSYGRGRAANWIDFDNDGKLDLFVSNHGTDNVLYRNEGGSFADYTDNSQIGKNTGFAPNWIDFDQDNDLDVLFTAKDAITLWENDEGLFTEVTAEAGFDPSQDYSSGAWADYDNDGDLDVFLTRGIGGYIDVVDTVGNTLFLSDSNGQNMKGVSFQKTGTLSLNLYTEECQIKMNVVIGENNSNPTTMPFQLDLSEAQGQPNFDLGKDEHRFFVWYENGRYNIYWRGKEKSRGYFYGVVDSDNSIEDIRYFGFTPQDLPPESPQLYRNDNGVFTDVTSESKLTKKGNFRSASWADYDNDGDSDLYVVDSGKFYGNVDNTLYINNGDGTFSDVTINAKVGGDEDGNGRGDGSSWSDFDNDGDLDLYVTNGAYKVIYGSMQEGKCLEWGPHKFYSNDGNSNNWIRINLVGTISNRDAIGAKIALDNVGTSQFFEVNTGQSFMSQSKKPIHFGLGKANSIESLEVRWPSGLSSTLQNIPVNQTITIVEGD